MNQITETQKAQLRKIAVEKWDHKNARNPMVRKDGSVVVTIDGPEGTLQIFVGWDTDLLKEC